METDLSNRLHAYAEALASAHAASAAASASIICSHTRELRGDSVPDYLLPGQDELAMLVADGAPPATILPLDAAEDGGDDGIANIALGADGVASLKGRNG